MGKYKIGVLVGSLSKNSINRKLAEALVKLTPDNFEFKFLDIGSLPVYNYDNDGDIPAAAKSFKQAIAETDAFLMVTPEYNRSVPSVLKNAIDTGSRPWGQNSWAGKPVAIIGASIGPCGTAIAQGHLRASLACLQMRQMNLPEAYITITDDFYNADGTIGVRTAGFLKTWMESFVSSVTKEVAKA